MATRRVDRRKVDRRKGPDLLQRSFLWLVLICWGLFLAALLAFHFARPELEYGLLRFSHANIRGDWDPKTSPIFLYSLWSCCGVTLISSLINFKRNRRAGDYQFFYFVFLLVIVLVSLVAFYV